MCTSKDKGGMGKDPARNKWQEHYCYHEVFATNSHFLIFNLVDLRYFNLVDLRYFNLVDLRYFNLVDLRYFNL